MNHRILNILRRHPDVLAILLITVVILAHSAHPENILPGLTLI